MTSIGRHTNAPADAQPSWEMSTIGHPLADLTNLLTPFVTANNPMAKAMKSSTAGGAKDSFLPGATPGLPSRSQCVAWYSELAGWDPRHGAELTWGDAFNVFKGSIIMQGIAARHAVRQASSERASEYAVMMKPFGMVAWSLVEAAMKQSNEKARL